MDRLLRYFLQQFIRRGAMTVTTASGVKFSCGDGTGEPVAVRVEAPAEVNGKQQPVGGIPIPCPPLAELRAALAGLPFTDDVMAMVERAYTPGVSMGQGFRTLMKTLLAKAGPKSSSRYGVGLLAEVTKPAAPISFMRCCLRPMVNTRPAPG